MQQMLDKNTSQYDEGFEKVKKDYDFLMKLKLFNKENLVVLNGTKNYVRSKLKNSSSIDFSIDANVKWALNIINDYFTMKPIKDEIIVLNTIGKEVVDIKNTYPNSFERIERYKELIQLVAEIENCHAELIWSIASTHNLKFN